MVKVQTSDNSLPLSARKKINKNSSFGGVQFKKTPKIRRKSLALALPTPLIHRKDKTVFNEWTVTEEKFINNLSKKKRKRLSADLSTADENDFISNSVLQKTKNKTKTVSTEPTSNNEGNIGVNTSSIRSLQKEKRIISVEHILNERNNLEVNSVKSVKGKKKLENKNFPRKSPLEEKQQHIVKQVHSKLNVADLEQKLNIKAENVEKAVRGVIKFRSENPKLHKQLFQNSAPLFLQINCMKLPRGHSRILRIPLPNVMYAPEDEICLIVPEVKGIKNIEHERHTEHYEDLLRKKGVSNIKKIMTRHELRTEFETFEQKARLVDLYDIFLVDGRISGKVVKKCGKIFYKKRKVPTAVKLHVTKLKEHINKALSKTFFFLHLKGNSYSVQFGHENMEVKELVENVYSIFQYLDTQFPGGFQNIKGVQVYAARAIPIPIYLNFDNPNNVKVPKVKSKKPKAYKSHKGELTTLDNAAEVVVRPSGEVLIQRGKNIKRKRRDNTITDDIGKANKNTHDDNKKKKSRKRKLKELVTEENAEAKRQKIISNKQKVKKNDVIDTSVGVAENKREIGLNTHQQNHETSVKKIAKKNKKVDVHYRDLESKENVNKVIVKKDVKKVRVANEKEKRK